MIQSLGKGAKFSSLTKQAKWIYTTCKISNISPLKFARMPWLFSDILKSSWRSAPMSLILRNAKMCDELHTKEKKSDADGCRQFIHPLKAKMVKISFLISICRANPCKLRSPSVTIAILHKNGTKSSICNSSKRKVSNMSYLLLEVRYNIIEVI